MQPDSDPIRAYIREHGDRYTSEALRRELIAAGHDPAAIDAALREHDEARAAAAREPATSGSRFWLLALGLNALVLIVAGVWIVNSASGRYAGLVIGVLVAVMLIGLGISGLIGRWVLRRSGLALALVVPLVTALLLGGTCMALSGPLVAQPKPGTMQVHILAPLAFDGSGSAVCEPGSAVPVNVTADYLGKLDGNIVTASLQLSSLPAASGADIPKSDVALAITFAGTGERAAGPYVVVSGTSLKVEADPKGLIGTVQFKGLGLEPIDRPASESTPAPISGSVSWDCS